MVSDSLQNSCTFFPLNEAGHYEEHYSYKVVLILYLQTIYT